jgi:hypothetical protein
LSILEKALEFSVTLEVLEELSLEVWAVLGMLER